MGAGTIKRFIVYDSENFDTEFKDVISEDDFVIPAKDVKEYCVGCFGCWVKNPGKCIKEDGYENISSYMGSCQEMIIISRLTFGGYSPCIKNVIDRSTGFHLPFFGLIKGEMFRKKRYDDSFKLSVYFYGGKVEYQENAIRLVNANIRNLGVLDYNIKFYNDSPEIREELLSK
ncbi:MAG: flavodoxin family protein [Lachnospiraceae bacterium]|nr:flavodoxin family protein [Lachnospiraceae bacterium]